MQANNQRPLRGQRGFLLLDAALAIALVVIVTGSVSFVLVSLASSSQRTTKLAMLDMAADRELALMQSLHVASFATHGFTEGGSVRTDVPISFPAAGMGRPVTATIQRRLEYLPGNAALLTSEVFANVTADSQKREYRRTRQLIRTL